MNPALDAPLSLLARDYRALRALGQPVVLATMLDTAGSTYRKAGARMLITREGEVRGLLSGGCLEHDLAAHAADVLGDGRARVVSYDTRGLDDPLFGLGAGCEGAMRILLQRVGPNEDWQPLEAMAKVSDTGHAGALVTVVAGEDRAYPPGSAFWEGGRSVTAPEPAVSLALRAELMHAPPGSAAVLTRHADGMELLAARLLPPARLLLLGAGPDAIPLARLAAGLGMQVTVADHRPAYIDGGRFPDCMATLVDPAALQATLQPTEFDAAVVMSHSLAADGAYLRALAAGGPGYVGLLGPAARRERLLADLGAASAALAGRLRGPVGLDIGARTPEAIAVAIVAEIHAVLSRRSGTPFMLSAGQPPAPTES